MLMNRILGQNFMGEVYRILYKNTKTKNESSSLILKIAPRHRISSEKMKLRNMFLREIQMYDEVSCICILKEQT